MLIQIDFNSPEALYRQLCHQIILGIAMNELREGDSLPSVRELASTIGINMHPVNKAYSILREEGYLTVDRRRGAVVFIDLVKINTREKLRCALRIDLANSNCKDLTKEDVHALIDEIYEEYQT